MRRLPKTVLQHIEKAKSAVLAAVENYNKPGISFRTRTFTMLVVVGWTALFHAIFYKKGRKPWYVKSGSGRGIRYEYIDGDPKYWGLAECLKQYYGDDNPAEKANIEFLLKLRHKIEHRNHPELDPILYGECQATLINFENLLVKEFGNEMALSMQFYIALQFSYLSQEQQEIALKQLKHSSVGDLLEFISTFRDGIPSNILSSTNYSFKVFLVPKLANSTNAADLAVEFVHYDSLNSEQKQQIQKALAIIKEKQIPVVSKGLMKPKQVVERLNSCLPFSVSAHTHIQAWKFHKVRPQQNSAKPEQTNSKYCIYDELAGGYGYTDAWVRKLYRELNNDRSIYSNHNHKSRN